MPPWLNPDTDAPASAPAARKEPKQGIRALLGWLGDHEHQLQLALEAAELGQWHWNPVTGELVWSDRTRELLGVAPDTPASFELFQSLVHPDDRATVGKAIETALQNRSAYSVEYRVVLADGSTRWLHSLGRARYYATRSTPASMSGVVRDVTANHRASEAWHAQRQYLQQLMQSVPMGVAKFDLQLRFLSANKAFVDGLRLGGQELSGRPLYEVLPEIPAAWRAELARGLTGTGARADVEPLARRDGTVDWIARQIHPWYDQRSQVGGILLVTDICTVRRQIESQERLWANAFAHAAHGMAIIDPRDASLRCANAAYASLLGRSSAALAGTPLALLCAESAREPLQAAIERATADNGASLELEHRHLDGTPIGSRIDLVCVRDPQDGSPYLVATITDLRVRPAPQWHPQESPGPVDPRFRLLADSTALAIVMADARGLLNYANPAWLALTAIPLGQALDRDWCECVHPDDRARVQQACARLRHGSGASLEFRYRRPGGEVRWVQAHATALQDEAGHTPGFLCASHDITDSLQQRANADRIHSQVRALAQRLQQLREVERSEIAGSLQERVGKGLAQLITSMGELARPGVEESQLRKAQPQLARLAGDTLEKLRHVVFELTPPGVGELGFEGAMQRLVSDQGNARDTQIVLSLPDKALQVHQWTLCVLHEVAREALANALQHAHATRIDLQVELRGESVRLRVRDNGAGMLPQDRNKPGCFGLLAASERLAQIGGTLRVVSVRDEGTTIEASAPLATDVRALGDPGEAL